MSPAWFDVAALGVTGRRVHAVRAEREPELRDALAAAGFRVFVVDGARVTSPETLFDALGAALGLPSSFGRNWDALIDALGDFTLKAGRLAILWRDADQTLGHHVQTVLETVLILDAAAVDAAEDDGTQLETFLLGTGAGF
jgi:RNAse (barnase) inhibitor barstar